MDKTLTKNKQIQAERKQFPDRYLTRTSEGYFTQTGQSFRMYEGPEEQFTNLVARWSQRPDGNSYSHLKQPRSPTHGKNGINS